MSRVMTIHTVRNTLPSADKVLFGAFCGAVVGVATVSASAAAGAAQARASDLGVSEADTRCLRQDTALLEAVQSMREYCTTPEASVAYRDAVLRCEDVVKCYHDAVSDNDCPRHWALKVHGASSRAVAALRKVCALQPPGSRDAVLCAEASDAAVTLLDNYVHNIMLENL